MSHPQFHKFRASVVAPALVILIGLLLRIVMLGVDMRFHPDEALFAAQARLISHDGDVLLRDTDLDKPPLTFYVTALAFRVLEPSEFAARLPNVLSSGLSLAVLYALANVLYRDRAVAVCAALLLALSPYDLAFAATVFTDVQATLWVLVGCWFAVRDRWAWAGAAAGLMFAAKSTSLLALPLIIALGIARNATRTWTVRDFLRRLAAFVGLFAAGVTLLLLWDLGRAPRSFFDLGYQRNDPGRLIRSDELWPRLEQWGHWLSFITGSQTVNAALLALVPVWLVKAVWQYAPTKRKTPLIERPRAVVIDWLIAGYSLAFLGWYWLVAFPTYDRYMHILVPFAILLAARSLVGVWRWSGARRVTLIVAAVLMIGLLLPGTFTALRGETGIAGDQGQHTGIDNLANYLNTELEGETVYDHWLGWELAYYLAPSPQVQLRYIDLPEALPDDIAAQPTPPHYFVAPSSVHAVPWLAALHRAGISTAYVYNDTRHGFVVYRLYFAGDSLGSATTLPVYSEWIYINGRAYSYGHTDHAGHLRSHRRSHRAQADSSLVQPTP